MSRRLQIGCLIIALLGSLLAACGRLEVGFEQTPTPDTAMQATITALSRENDRLATQVAGFSVAHAGMKIGKIVYVQGGDLWVKSLPEADPVRLTTDGLNSEPRWSAGGGWIAFRKGDTQVWVMRANGENPRPLGGGALIGEFAWAPHRDQLAYVVGVSELRLYDAVAEQSITLVSRTGDTRSQGEIGNICWQPDGALLAYELRELQESSSLNYRGIWTVAVDASQRSEVYRGEATLAGWTADSAWLLFWLGGGSSSAATEGLPLIALSIADGQRKALVDSTLAYRDFMAPDPYSQRIALVVGGQRGTWTNKSVQVIIPNEELPLKLTPPGQAAISPAWSPDGQFLAYATAPDRRVDAQDLGEAARRELQQRRIAIIRVADGSIPQVVTDNPAYRDEWPRWSIDGSLILFVRIDTEGQPSLWMMNPRGDAPRRMVDALSPTPEYLGYYGHTDWGQLFDWWQEP